MEPTCAGSDNLADIFLSNHRFKMYQAGLKTIPIFPINTVSTTSGNFQLMKFSSTPNFSRFRGPKLNTYARMV